MGTERNAPCPCGSGKKYKRCCALKQTGAMSQTTMIVLVVVLIGGALAVFSMVNTDTSGQPRQVWSDEHGHYHQVP
jgi:hypothetical protein